MPPFMFRASNVSSDDPAQWPSDPTAELDFEEFLGLRDAPNRPLVARGRMTLFKSTERTVAIIEGWGFYPPIVDVLPGTSAPVRAAKRSRKAKTDTAPRMRRIGSAPMSTASSSAEGEELLTTQAAALYCGYLDGVGIRKAKFDGLLVPAQVGKNRSYLWRRSDLDAHNRRRGYVPSDAQNLTGRVVHEECSLERKSAGATEMLAAGDTAPVLLDARPELTEPVVEPSKDAASVSSIRTDVSDQTLGLRGGSSPSMHLVESVEIASVSQIEIADRSEPSGPALASSPSANELPERTDKDRTVVVPAARRWRPLAAVLQVVVSREVLGALVESSSVAKAPPKMPTSSVVWSRRCKTNAP